MFEFHSQKSDIHTNIKQTDFKMQLKPMNFMHSSFKSWLKREQFFHKIVYDIYKYY